MSNDLVHRLQAWLTMLVSSDSTSIRGNDIAAVAVDLDGMHDAGFALAAIISDALGEPPTRDAAESLAIELDVEVSHLLSHWSRAKAILGMESGA